MMADTLQNHINVTENNTTDLLERLQRSPSETPDVSAKYSDDNLQGNVDHDSEVDVPKKRVKRRIKQFSDSDSDGKEQENDNAKSGSEKDTEEPQGSDNDSEIPDFIRVSHKSRIQKVSEESSSDSDSSKSRQTGNESSCKEKLRFPQVSDCDENIPKSIPQKIKVRCNGTSSESDQALKNEQQQIRSRNKRNKIKNKFKSLMSAREKGSMAVAENEGTKSSNSSEDSDNVETTSSIEKIKQKIKERMVFKPSICDPDTSDEEMEGSQQKSIPKQKKERRIKLTSPKPQRMSAKQAMENMQKIKSESNRMLREKEVSLPYHRPKALSLKDIMSRRKPAVSSDGKSFKIKMNGEQLKQYAQMLEDRQKQMMELWQSDSEEEYEDKKSSDEEAIEKTIDLSNSEAKIETGDSIHELKEIETTNEKVLSADVSADNDKLFDDLSQSIIEHTKTTESNKNEGTQVESVNEEKVPEEQDSETNMKLVFNDSETSITDEKLNADTEMATEKSTDIENFEISDNNNDHQNSKSDKTNTEIDSQLISLHYDTENLDTETSHTENEMFKEITDENTAIEETIDARIVAMEVDNGFSDDDMNIEDIDNIIENADIIRDIEDKVNSQVLIRDRALNLKPKLAGAPGMVIDLDDSDNIPKKSGMELLKERFTFFAKLRTPEELEREKERKIKPGHQHLKLKQALEEQMAEQRSFEWTKRLEDEKQQQKELKELRGEESDDENDIDKLEAKLEGEGNEEKEADVSENEEAEEELLENDVDISDKPRAKNPMLENEAEESDCDDDDDENEDRNEQNEEDEEDENVLNNGDVNDGDDDDEDEETSDSESEPEEQPTTKKGRILKAFEDSDDEEVAKVGGEKDATEKSESVDLPGNLHISQVSDDVLTLAQRHKSVSEDLFSECSTLLASQTAKSQAASGSLENDVDLGTQTFSILDPTINMTVDLLNTPTDKSGVICETQTYDDKLDAVAGMCSGSFSQGLPSLPITQFSQSQPIGEDILALCTGKFYDNEFVSQVVDNNQMPLGASQEFDSYDDSQKTDTQSKLNDVPVKVTEAVNDKLDTINEDIANTKVTDEIHGKVDENKKVDYNLKSILDELDDPEFDTPRPNKFFCGDTQTQINSQKEREGESVKKKFTIDSDDDTNAADATEIKKRKKLTKKRPEKRALQISDDEEDEVSEQDEMEESDIEEETTERLIEYDSEENEIEVQPKILKPSKKKRKGNEFFEQEAELTSEDEWVGSGDEDEAGLDRMEREAGDDEIFHQGRLQRELGQIHMRDVLDQDKREVRIIQELLFEDGDLGGGGRQRKFKWKNLEGEEEEGVADELRNTQEEEFESEEQWRKQRHERETFLRQMQNNGENEESLNVSINRTTIIKANLMSKTMSMLLEEHKPTEKTEQVDLVVVEKKTARLPSPNKPFSLLQQSYQGSILNRGKGALARLAALATPLAVDDDAPQGKSAAAGSRRNFVFATLTHEPPKVAKRKAEVNPSTPKLVKKMKTEEKQNTSRNSLLDRMKM